MKIISVAGRGNFIIQRDNYEILQVKYKNWFSSNAKTKLGNENIEIKAKNIWQSKFDIIKNKKDVGDIIFNWKGDIIIRILNKENIEENFLLKSKGFWKSYFELINEEGEIVCILNSSVNWSKLNYNYEVENITDKYDEIKIYELTIYSVFGANIYMMMMTAAATGGV
ncbi:hypothetical protein SAMN05443429_10231 [Cruoricaptor ignavus]|uniref:Uncharacterized protein n=1 Tax=Cruoricaptor ignavus TaxID=1118202 RepID=A0A1M6BJQ6_9FLAO|nr:hypothetical protein [Cruoricaptor ignavus]SHI48951.1 hypothetical protein SAMN05443429_10231 [Cruoricaptor ignavus]